MKKGRKWCGSTTHCLASKAFEMACGFIYNATTDKPPLAMTFAVLCGTQIMPMKPTLINSIYGIHKQARLF